MSKVRGFPLQAGRTPVDVRKLQMQYPFHTISSAFVIETPSP
jgi:hypothetical protein